MSQLSFLAALALLLFTFPRAAVGQIMRGKVAMADGSAPTQRVLIERVCLFGVLIRETTTDRRGEFLWHVSSDIPTSVTRMGQRGPVQCMLRARIPGFESNIIDIQDPRVMANPELPKMVLHPVAGGEMEAPIETPKLPRAAARPWELGMKALTAKQWPEAELNMREVTRAAPDFALAWSGLGFACQSQNKTAEARDAFQHAVTADPASLLSRVQLMRLEMSLRLWLDASKTAEGLIRMDASRRYPEAHLYYGIASYSLQQMDAAQASLSEALRLDPQHQMPQAEYFMGAVLSAKGDRAGAAAHLRSYLAIAPSAPNTAFVKTQIERLTAPETVPPPALPVPETLVAPTDQAVFTTTGEAWVPGGRKALAAIAHLKGVPSSEDFFLEYCRAVASETSRLTDSPTPGYSAALQAYIASVTELMDLGDRRDDRTVITLSLAGREAQEKAQRVLALLGWKVVRGAGDSSGATVELGDQPVDGPRQQIFQALGIDALAMQEALEAGRSFKFEILSENAVLAGGAAWGPLLQEFATLRGGMAEAFIRQPRLARTYAGLDAMGAETAAALAKRMTLQMLATVHASTLWLYGDTFRVTGGKAAVPGGDDVWTKLAGTSSRDPVRFFEALLKMDRGRLAAFYAALTHADAAHQKFFLKDLPHAQRYYAWYHNSEELRAGIGRPANVWRPMVFRNLPLDENGGIRFPGGRQAWSSATSDDEALFPSLRRSAHPASTQPAVDFEALLEVDRLQRERGVPLDPESATLLVRNFAPWRPLFPYFAALPDLRATEFQALEAFTNAAAGYARPSQNVLVSEWHSLVALIVLGRRAGSLDDSTAARAFGRVCRGLTGTEHSASALLREIAGSSPNLDEAVATHLLRLSGPRRAAFDRVRELQQAPNLSSDPAKIAAALNGVVYAAILDPDGLLVNEDRALLAKHAFVMPAAERRAGLFYPASLVASSAPAGSHFTGGFANFDEVARTLTRAAGVVTTQSAPEIGGSGAASPALDAPATIFRANARLVEVHTVVTDGRGRYVDDLAADRFVIREGGKPVSIAAFEDRAASVSCALLLDTSLSMDTALPALKNAAVKLIRALRAGDAVAVYSLSGGISELQSFTTDKTAAVRAVLAAGLGGQTALYDALVRVNRDLGIHTGKKAIVVFTDGEDNASTLSAETATLRAKTAGVPIYTVAQGHAVQNRQLRKELGSISQATGGLTFTIQSAEEIGAVFESILQDLLHGYLLAFQPQVEDRAWRAIEVLLSAPAGRKVRAREGYFPE